MEKNGANPVLTSKIDERFLRYQMQAAAKYILPNNRVGICLRHQIQKYGDVDLYKHRLTQKAFYGGLMVCGSVWVCPVCAAKISERRRSELKKVFKGHIDQGGECTMLTLTFSHSNRDRLKDLLSALSNAMKAFAKTEKFHFIRKEMAVIGSIRAFEITYGENGWHPHIHLLLLHNNEIEPWDRYDLQDRFYDMWSAACEESGLSCSREHGLKMDDAKEASTYIGKWGDLMDKKWGTDSEMTKANIKRGRAGSFTPFDFLRVVAEDGDLEYADRFKEYAAAVKGKHQLHWSRGLKQRFEIEEKTDEEVATEKVEQADWLGALDWKDWRYIVQNKLRVRLLEQIEQDGFEDALQNLGLRNVQQTK